VGCDVLNPLLPDKTLWTIDQVQLHYLTDDTTGGITAGYLDLKGPRFPIVLMTSEGLQESYTFDFNAILYSLPGKFGISLSSKVSVSVSVILDAALEATDMMDISIFCQATKITRAP